MQDEKLALFDFCETLVSIQSADSYIDFVRENKRETFQFLLEILRIFLVKFRIFAFLNKILHKNILHKKFKLFQLRGIKKSTLEKLARDYYNKTLKHKLIPQIISELKQKQNEGYRTVIVSGGYSIYIKYFCQDYGIDIDDVVATDISFDKNEICKGKIKGLDCMKKNKIVKLKQKVKNIENFNLKDSYAYSDSLKDLALLKFVGNGVVVSKETKIWAKKNNLMELIW